ncbi:MAG: SWIM zinc finger domain-containing protein [Granulosicoccus sp.]
MITADQVTVLAPDAASYKAGKALATHSKWSDLGHTGHMLWGLAKGSGSKPYMTQVALPELACNCTCPSRKFPCKHGLGLMFLAADDLSLFRQKETPDWVTAWHESRAAREAKKSQTNKNRKPKNEASVAKTLEKRTARVDEGITFLQEFLLDIISQGLGQPAIEKSETWDTAARRLIDYQAPGLARQVRILGDWVHSTPQWEQHLLYEMGSLYAMLQSYQQRDLLSNDLRREIEQRIGWQIDKEEVLKSQFVSDNWFVAFQTISRVEKLTSFANWLYGQNHNQWALILSFNTSDAVPAGFWPVGSTISTELAYYPGAVPERAIPTSDKAEAIKHDQINVHADSIGQLLQRVSQSMALNPWQSRYPFLLNAQPLLHDNNALILIDDQGHGLPLKATPEEYLMINGVCGGQPTLLAGEWDGDSCRIHALRDHETWFSLRAHSQ